MHKFEEYSEKCSIAYKHGTENSYYTSIEELIKTIFNGNPNYVVINNPRAMRKLGHPDIQVKKSGIPILNIEVKKPDVNIEEYLANPNMDAESKRLSEQVRKYKSSEHIIVMVTNLKNIYWIDSEKLSDNSSDPIPILYITHILNDDLTVHINAEKEWNLMQKRIYVDTETIKSGIKNIIDNVMPFVFLLKEELIRIIDNAKSDDEKVLYKHLIEVRKDLEKTLFKESKEDFKKQFIDLYVQVIAYGMFMAWIRFHKNPSRKSSEFNLNVVSSYLPSGSLVQNLFSGIRDNLTNTIIEKIFTPMEKVFNNTEYSDIANKIDELMNEFYSDFLERYDKKVKKDMGVIYTPEEVVAFMIRGIDYLIANIFDMPKGILEQRVKYLDPASGTMAYPCMLMHEAYKKISKKIDDDSSCFGTEIEKKNRFNQWFREMFLRREKEFGNVFGFEILMAPYILGTLRTLITAESLGANIDFKTDRPQLYLMNTLMDLNKDKTIEECIAEVENQKIKSELKDALRVRNTEDIMVVMGNPPYNISSQNASKWITQLVDEYISEDNLTREKGKPKIKKIAGLASTKDDYWKFLRFAQWKIAESGKQGIVAFITNNFYIDGLVARGLRKEFRKAFDEIYIVNLHGDWKKAKNDRCIGKDENIFGVNCGVAIMFAIRYDAKKHAKNKEKDAFKCKVKYTEIFGSSNEKLKKIGDMQFNPTTFIDVMDNLDWEFTPYINQDDDYNTFPYLCDIFKKNINGIKTGHDYDLMDYDVNSLTRKIEKWYSYYYKNYESLPEKVSVSWNPRKVKNTTLKRAISKIMEWQWRGFDRRYFCFDTELMQSHRYSLMQYILPHQNNVGLIVTRQSRGRAVECTSSHLISNTISECCCLEGASGLSNYVFPLKINTSSDPDDFDHPKPAIHSNINDSFMEQLPYYNWKGMDQKEHFEWREKVFYYIYGILYSPTYRQNYKGLLAKDFPHIPFPNSNDTFTEMSHLGKKLASYHLMTDSNTQNIKRVITNLDQMELKDGKIDIKIGNRYKWIPHDDDPNIGDIYFDTKQKSKTTSDGKEETNDMPIEGCFVVKSIPKAVWEFEIGGIMQLDQWLGSRRYSAEPKKDHLTRGINEEELKYFIKIINAITDTITILPEIDTVYKKIEKDIKSFTI